MSQNSLFTPTNVIPAKAGIQSLTKSPWIPGQARNDGHLPPDSSAPSVIHTCLSALPLRRLSSGSLPGPEATGLIPWVSSAWGPGPQSSLRGLFSRSYPAASSHVRFQTSPAQKERSTDSIKSLPIFSSFSDKGTSCSSRDSTGITSSAYRSVFRRRILPRACKAPR